MTAPNTHSLPPHGKLLTPSPAGTDEEHFEPLLQTDAACIERIVSNGQASPPGFWYDQPDDEWVALIAGHAELLFGDDGAGTRLAMQAGDWVTIPARRRHRVESTSADAVWLAVHIRSGGATVKG